MEAGSFITVAHTARLRMDGRDALPRHGGGRRTASTPQSTQARRAACLDTAVLRRVQAVVSRQCAAPSRRGRRHPEASCWPALPGLLWMGGAHAAYTGPALPGPPAAASVLVHSGPRACTGYASPLTRQGPTRALVRRPGRLPHSAATLHRSCWPRSSGAALRLRRPAGLSPGCASRPRCATAWSRPGHGLVTAAPRPGVCAGTYTLCADSGRCLSSARSRSWTCAAHEAACPLSLSLSYTLPALPCTVRLSPPRVIIYIYIYEICRYTSTPSACSRPV
jgi:hypothetical protein